MKQSDRIAALEAAVKELQEQVAALKSNAPASAEVKQEKVNETGRWALQIMVDDGMWEWYADVTKNERITFATKEEADNFAKNSWRFYRTIQL